MRFSISEKEKTKLEFSPETKENIFDVVWSKNE